jgi:DNA-binding ferritin-like protein
MIKKQLKSLIICEILQKILADVNDEVLERVRYLDGFAEATLEDLIKNILIGDSEVLIF